ncbi:hypothetical protein HUW51_12840 [Adhaeribacter swui]|uniref:DUF2214 domain-containing protein n=1 Tax=Adhaeribacter swui TaxID=2086471 RepID=A0A7G7G8S9_9BACT|nr:hypothetical protein [Adhaeribacter swui]QNF33563.1 hypothetical protein HUW51_12840 [Adhaeribacter swui]
MTGSYTEWLTWLEKSSWAATIRQSNWLYQWLEIGHITGIALLVGAAFLFDLRLLGNSRFLPVTGLVRYLLPWSRRGLILVVPTGILLFITNAAALGHDPTFWLKMGLLILAGLNATIFHTITFTTVVRWDVNRSTPPKAKLAAGFSLVLWTAIIACGRLLAY